MVKHLTVAVVFSVWLASDVGLSSRATMDDRLSWDKRSAAAYLDGRQSWWMSWPVAARDHDTFCVSCHTAVPYALARPALRAALGESAPSANERKLVENVARRVTLWKEVEPFYSDQTDGIPKSGESRGTEAVLNALILANRDAQAAALSAEGRQAFANLWALQIKTGDHAGSWPWLNFQLEPWESADASYFGAALGAIAVGTAPGHYASSPDIQDRLNLLREFLRRGAEGQHMFNRLMLLWASVKVPELLSPEQQRSIIDAVRHTQHQDGGWSMADLGPWKRIDGTSLDAKSDGYATGVVALVLQEAGTSRSEPEVKRGLIWLVQNQDKADGRWPAASLNTRRDPTSNIGRFMSDAATGYAVLALTAAH